VNLSQLQTLVFISHSLTIGGFKPATLARAIGQGQFRCPRGAEYGGQKREPQIEAFIQRLSKLMSDYKNIVLIDLHTGLGSRYELHLIPGDEKSGVDPELFAKLFEPKNLRHHFDTKVDTEIDADVDAQVGSASNNRSNPYVWTPTSTAGFYPTQGDLNSLLPKLASTKQKVLALTFEFGTLGNSPWAKIETIHRLRLENVGFHEGYSNKKVEIEVSRLFEELFYPKEARWRKNAISRSRRLLLSMFNRLA
jgi:hypothetical protein